MAGLLDFDAAKLDGLVNQYGLKQAWLNILATNIKKRDDLAYILQEQTFVGFQTLDTDILGGLSIGDIGVLYEYCVARVDSDSRKDNGQFFTPDDVASFMVEKALDFPSGRWLDPCAGIGNLSWHLVNAQKDREAFLIESLVLADKDELALLIARVLLTIHFQRKRKRLFKEIESNFIVFDFLSVAESGVESLFRETSLREIPEHDFVIVNPPYLATKEDRRFETSKSRDLYAYFLENIIKTSKGFVSITPQSFTNASKFADLRRLLLQSFSNLTIYNFDNIPGNIFRGFKFGSKNSNTANSIRVAITVAKPGIGSRRITSLTRWRTSEREEMLKAIDIFLSEPELTAEFFPKVNRIMEPLYSQMITYPRLSDLLSQKTTDHALYVPAAPRYFISALKSPVSRTSQRTLYFRSVKELNAAYCLINSSFMYWWWRVRDGGMTLSLETLKSLPLPIFEADRRLVLELEKSEKTNRVYKRNAGADQENVKHSALLIDKLNTLIMPEFREQLIATHQNSDLIQLRFLLTPRGKGSLT